VRVVLIAICLVSCVTGSASDRLPKTASPPPNDQLRMAFVYGAPNEKDLTRLVSVQTYRTSPRKGERWTLVDTKGFLADVEITEPEPGECDHCPPFRMLARVLEHRGDKDGTERLAIGPATGPLRNARITKTNWQWHSQLHDKEFTFELEIDADGDGAGDIARWVRGPQIEYEIRARIGGVWTPRERWLTADILDVMDRCPDSPTDDDDGCPK